MERDNSEATFDFFPKFLREFILDLGGFFRCAKIGGFCSMSSVEIKKMGVAPKTAFNYPPNPLKLSGVKNYPR